MMTYLVTIGFFIVLLFTLGEYQDEKNGEDDDGSEDG